MNRKEFIIKSCTGACAAISSGFILSAVLQACKTPLGVVKTKAQDGKVILPLTAFATGNYKLARVNNYHYDIAVEKKEDGSFMALVMQCTHAAQPLTKTGEKYYCTAHGSQFSHEGKVLKGPASRDMTRLQTTTDKDNLYIHLK